MRITWWVLAALSLSLVTACGSHATSDRSAAVLLAAGNTCQSHVDRRFHLPPVTGRTIEEGVVKDLGHGRLRVTGVVPGRAGLAHPASYTCVVVPGPTGPRVVEFHVQRSA